MKDRGIESLFNGLIWFNELCSTDFGGSGPMMIIYYNYEDSYDSRHLYYFSTLKKTRKTNKIVIHVCIYYCIFSNMHSR